MQIGTFTQSPDGYAGRLQTLTLDVALRLVRLSSPGAERTPDWRIMLEAADGTVEVGAGWSHRSDKAGDYVAVQLDCPTFPRPIRANLLRSPAQDGEHLLLWSPRVRRPKAG
ncbi:DUF736 domain-containing protein [Sphingomonas sp. OTU376]|uniref:DUF736 domain-containing protein n=1 Tax=Sphingomonas sp. OTU376 TaxID=3043863 RepID=UPI00313D09FA